MPLPRPLVIWPRVPRSLQGMLDWAESLIRQMDLSLVRGAPKGIITLDGIQYQAVLTPTGNPLVFRAPFDIAVQTPLPTSLPDTPPAPPGAPLATLAVITTIGGAVKIVPWSPAYPPLMGYWTLHPVDGEQTVVLGTAPGGGTSVVFLSAVLA